MERPLIRDVERPISVDTRPPIIEKTSGRPPGRPQSPRRRARPVLLGRGAASNSTGCPAAASTSPTRPSTATRAARGATGWRSASSAPRHVDLTYAELARRINRFANVLTGLGVARGRAACSSCAGRIPELYVAVLGTSRPGVVVSPAVLGVRARSRSPRG